MAAAPLVRRSAYCAETVDLLCSSKTVHVHRAVEPPMLRAVELLYKPDPQDY